MNRIQGTGLGLRPCHYSHIEKERPPIPWFEVLTDNYLHDHGPGLKQLEKIRSLYPMTLHGVGMSLGSTDPLNFSYLKPLKKMIDRFKPSHVSDHLCWVSFNGEYFHELLPLPYTSEAITHTAKRIQQVQDFLGQRILIENVSNYLTFAENEYSEWEFLQNVAEEADCLILLDINNIYVSAVNNHWNPNEYLEKLTTHRVAEFHLAGFLQQENFLLDNHGTSIDNNVWELYQFAVKKFGKIPTLIERDNHIPSFETLMAEVDQANRIQS